jgi:hypothetical protein
MKTADELLKDSYKEKIVFESPSPIRTYVLNIKILQKISDWYE